jgi:hypothetical protein
MERPIVLVVIGALAGATVGIINGGGELGRRIADGLADTAYSALTLLETKPAPPPRADANSDDERFSFSACVRKSGGNVERTLRDLLEFHEHDATLKLVGCLLDGAPDRFCSPHGRQQVADAMEIYFWSREDVRHTSPAHGLADKIHLLDRAAENGAAAANPDPFVLTWSGPADEAIFDRLRNLVKQGYLDPGAFAFSGRAELREALRGVMPEASPCVETARGG